MSTPTPGPSTASLVEPPALTYGLYRRTLVVLIQTGAKLDGWPKSNGDPIAWTAAGLIAESAREMNGRELASWVQEGHPPIDDEDDAFRACFNDYWGDPACINDPEDIDDLNTVIQWATDFWQLPPEAVADVFSITGWDQLGLIDGEVPRGTELTPEQKATLLADFVYWSGGYPPSEVEPAMVETYLQLALDENTPTHLARAFLEGEADHG